MFVLAISKFIQEYNWECSVRSSEEATIRLRKPGQSTLAQRLLIQCMLYKWMFQEAQLVATIRKPIARGQSETHCERSDNQRAS